jgi:hypothetical protein
MAAKDQVIIVRTSPADDRPVVFPKHFAAAMTSVYPPSPQASVKPDGRGNGANLTANKEPPR